MSKVRRFTIGAALAALLLSFGAGAGAGVAGAAPSGTRGPTPHISVSPDNVMVNTVVTLTGTGFSANTSVTIAECGETSWASGTDPCNDTNTVTVPTDARGRFRTSFTADVCPSNPPPRGVVTRRRCYVGEPLPDGADSVTLVAAAHLVVTYP